MAIEFKCPHCRETLRLKDKFAGQRGSCRHCGGEIVTPSPQPPEEMDLAPLDDAPPPAPAPRPAAARPDKQAASPRPAAKPAAAQQRPAAPAPSGANGTGELIRFHCEHCGAAMKSPASAAGRTVTCPRCNQRLRVPGTPLAKPPAPQPAPQPTSRPAAARTAPAARVAPRPAAPQSAHPANDGLELLPEDDTLELLPETNGFDDALGATIPVAASAGPLRPLPAARPLASSTKKRKSQTPVWQSPGLQAAGGMLTSLLVIALVGLKIYFRVVEPIVRNSTTQSPAPMASTQPANPSVPAPVASLPPTPTVGQSATAPPEPTAVSLPSPTVAAAPAPPAVPSAPTPSSSGATQMIADAQNVLRLLEQNLQLARQIVDAPSAQRLAGEWAFQFIDAVEAAEALSRYNGRVVSLSDKHTFEDLTQRSKDQANQIQSLLVQLAGRADVQPILADAIVKAVEARPNSAFAREFRKQGSAYSGMARIAQRRAEIKADQQARRAETDARMAEMRERVRARSGSMRNPRTPGRK